MPGKRESLSLTSDDDGRRRRIPDPWVSYKLTGVMPGKRESLSLTSDDDGRRRRIPDPWVSYKLTGEPSVQVS